MDTLKKIFSAPIITQIILLVVNTFFMMFTNIQFRGWIPILLTIPVTGIVMDKLDTKGDDWFAGALVYICGKMIVIMLLLPSRTGHRSFFPVGEVFVTGVIICMQFIIWGVVKSAKESRSRYDDDE